jgi:hypothetical protein
MDADARIKTARDAELLMYVLHRVMRIAFIGHLLLSAGCQSTAGEPTLDEVKAAAQKYQDVNVAKAEGYTTDNKCVTAEMLGFPAEKGAMGLHYVRRDLLGLPAKPAPPGGPRVAGTGTYTDFTKPAMLVYEPQANGTLRLVAVENLVFAKAWAQASGNRPPTFHGREWPLLKDDATTAVDEAHGWEPHFEQHLWVFRDNPNGAYFPFNPNVTCAHHQSAGPMKH